MYRSKKIAYFILINVLTFMGLNSIASYQDCSSGLVMVQTESAEDCIKSEGVVSFYDSRGDVTSCYCPKNIKEPSDKVDSHAGDIYSLDKHRNDEQNRCARYHGVFEETATGGKCYCGTDDGPISPRVMISWMTKTKKCSQQLVNEELRYQDPSPKMLLGESEYGLNNKNLEYMKAQCAEKNGRFSKEEATIRDPGVSACECGELTEGMSDFLRWNEKCENNRRVKLQ